MELFSQPKKRKKKMPKRKIETLAQWVVLSSKSNLLVWVTILTLVRLMCVLRAHIKLSMFRNIFSKIKKIVSTFSISEKYFSKNENYCVFRYALAKSFNVLNTPSMSRCQLNQNIRATVNLRKHVQQHHYIRKVTDDTLLTLPS